VGKIARLRAIVIAVPGNFAHPTDRFHGIDPLVIAAGRVRRVLTEAEERQLAHALIEMQRLMIEALAPEIERLARDLATCRDVPYLGRGAAFPIALEGALKRKEISYIHAGGIVGP
jgi:glucosamine--fructose-6-phosphate aminotransferase (isomerizing)